MQRVAAIGVAAFVLFIATIFAANWAVDTYGPVSVGFGLLAPAGVFFVGAAFLFRDVVQRFLGRIAALVAIVIGTGISALVSPELALASACAFAASELSDFAVFTALERWTVPAVVTSNVVGAVIDSLIFLSIAFGSLEFFRGQVVGKLWVTVAALPIVLLARKHLRPEPAAA